MSDSNKNHPYFKEKQCCVYEGCSSRTTHKLNIFKSVKTKEFIKESKQLVEQVLNEHKSCMMCNGFYGDNYGQPVCTTCHLFLYPCKSDRTIEIKEENEARLENIDAPVPTEGDPSFKDDNRGITDKDVPLQISESVLSERIKSLSVKCKYGQSSRDSGFVELIPPELLVIVFKYLDDISLFCASQVCSRWQSIIEHEVSQTQWKDFVCLRWPLFTPKVNTRCWKSVYAQLLNSSPCRHCLETMTLKTSLPIERNPWRHRQLHSELKTLTSEPPEGIKATPMDPKCYQWQASILGPTGSPYEGGSFLLFVQIPEEYPRIPPRVRFLTKILHPNISRHGDVSLDSLSHNWSMAMTISKVLISIQSLLTSPFTRVCMEHTLGWLFRKDRATFDRLARLCTWKFAMLEFVQCVDVSASDV